MAVDAWIHLMGYDSLGDISLMVSDVDQSSSDGQSRSTPMHDDSTAASSSTNDYDSDDDDYPRHNAPSTSHLS